jgi:hypothetical protein
MVPAPTYRALQVCVTLSPLERRTSFARERPGRVRRGPSFLRMTRRVSTALASC